MIHVDSKMIYVVSKIITVNSNLFFNFGAWNRNTHMWFRNWYMQSPKYGMLFRVDFGPITVSKLHMWYQNFMCCFETTLQISEITLCHVGKTGYFRVCSFPFSCMLFQKSLVSFWLFIMLFRNHTMWLRLQNLIFSYWFLRM